MCHATIKYKYCKHRNFSDLTIIATIEKTLFKFNAIYFMALYVIYKLTGNR